MDEKQMKELLLSMTGEIFKTFRLLAEENKKLTKRIEDLEKKFESKDKNCVVKGEGEMPKLEGMKEKFIVLKNEDLIGALQGENNDDLRESFKTVLYMVALYRQAQGKKTDNKYLVVNTDEPYADEVIEIMKRYGHWG